MSRDRQIHIKCTDAELRDIAERATAAGVSVSQLLRDLALAAKPCKACHGTGLDGAGKVRR